MQCQFNPVRRGRFCVAGVLAIAMLVVSAPGSVFAHEGHAALPSTGATVDGDQVLVSEGARKGLGLKTATVTLHDLSRTLRVRARVELPWDGQAMVTTLVPGHVRAIHANPGERVEAGQELAQIESLELETLQLTMLQAAEEVALAQRLVEQRQPLAEKGAIAGKSLLETKTQLRQKQVQLAIAERKLLALGISQETLRQVQSSGEPISSISVTSPIGGVVMHSDVRVGQFVDTEMHLFNIVDRSQVLLVGEVLETDVWQVERGQSVEASFPALPDHSFAAKIDHLRLGVGSDQRTLEVTTGVNNPNEALRPGMSGRMEITVYEAKDAIVCPSAALINTPGGTFVLLRKGDGKYQRREIKIGLRTPKRVEVLDGLFPGDRVVVTGAKLLASMFHTERKTTTQPQEAIASNNTSGGIQRSESMISVAQAVVELPTSGKAIVTPVIEGRIAAIHTQPGEVVQAGQLLAELDSQELRSLQLDLLETQEDLRRVTETLERVEPLAAAGNFPKTELWELQMEQRAAKMKLRNVQRKLAMADLSSEAIDKLRRVDLSQEQMNVGFATVPILAPTAGRVADFEVAPGQIVHAKDALFEIQTLDTVWIEGYVFEQHASQVEAGLTAEIQIPAYPKLRLAGQVVRTAPTLHSSTRVLPVWIEVENPDQKLREGMLASVEIRLPSTGRQVAVRPQAGE